MKSVVLPLFIMLTTAASALPQVDRGKMTGHVMDAQRGTPLSDATIVLSEAGIQGLTASNGRYFLINVPPGVYTVIAHREGYQPVTARNIRILAGVTREQNFTLSPAAPEPELPDETFNRDLFTPEEIMRYRSTIDLTNAQRDSITSMLRAVQSRILELQWRVAEQRQGLSELLARRAPEETAVREQMGRLLAAENAIKTEHLTLLVRIRRVLSEVQQERLRGLRELGQR